MPRSSKSKRPPDPDQVPAPGAAPAEIPRLLYRLAEVVEATSIPRRTLERERAAGRFPKPDVQVGKVPRWRPETIRAWVEKGGSL